MNVPLYGYQKADISLSFHLNLFEQLSWWMTVTYIEIIKIHLLLHILEFEINFEQLFDDLCCWPLCSERGLVSHLVCSRVRLWWGIMSRGWDVILAQLPHLIFKTFSGFLWGKGPWKPWRCTLSCSRYPACPRWTSSKRYKNITRYPRLKVRCAPKNQKVAKILTISSNHEVDFAKCFLWSDTSQQCPDQVNLHLIATWKVTVWTAHQ